jgi:hypothetical protein
MNAISVEATIKDIRTIHGENSGIDGDGLDVGVDVGVGVEVGV